MDLGFSLFDAEFYVLFEGVFPIFLNALGQTIAVETTDSRVMA